MRKRSARIFSAALSLTLALSCAPAALAAEDSESPARGVMTYEDHIAPAYEAAQSFSEGLAAVKQNGKWGYIDHDGNTVIPFQYDLACAFSEGYAIVGQYVGPGEPETDYQWDEAKEEYVPTGTINYDLYHLGFIDKSNKLTWFEGGTYDDNYDWVDGPLEMELRQGESIDPHTYVFNSGYISLNVYGPTADLFGTDGKARSISAYGWQVTEGIVVTGALDVEGGYQHFYELASKREIYVPYDEEEYLWIDLYPFNQGLAPAALVSWNESTEEYDSMIGFVDTSGNWVISPAYQSFMVSDFSSEHRLFGETGMAIVQDAAGKWGGIDKAGRTVLPFQYDGLYPYHFGMAPFEQDGKWGYLDAKGSVALPAQYVIVTGFSSSGYAVAYDGSKAFLIDTDGKAIPGADKLDPDTYFHWEDGADLPTTYVPDEYVVIEENGKYGYGRITYLPPLPEASEMDGWAYPEVVSAIEEELVPVYLQNLYLNDITREEFCDLAVQAIGEVLGKDIGDVVQQQTGKSLDAWQHEYPFADTNSSNVIAAYALGVVSGRGERRFDPYVTITRQEAAALLTRSAKVLGMDTSNAEDAGFTDSDTVGVWFKDAVNFVCQTGVMGGTGGNAFSPTGTYTREQSYVTIYRLFQAVAAAQGA